MKFLVIAVLIGLASTQIHDIGTGPVIISKRLQEHGQDLYQASISQDILKGGGIQDPDSIHIFGPFVISKRLQDLSSTYIHDIQPEIVIGQDLSQAKHYDPDNPFEPRVVSRRDDEGTVIIIIINTLEQLSQKVGQEFEQLSDTVLTTGTRLLTQALGGQADTQLVHSLVTPPGGRRAKSDVVEQRAKDVLNSFATDLKDKLNGEYTSAVHELQALAFKSLFMSHDQLKQKVQQIISSHSHQMTVIMEHLPADLVKFVEKAPFMGSGGLQDGLLGSHTQTASKLALQFFPHVQNVQQMLGNLGQTLTGTTAGLVGKILSALTDVHHTVKDAMSGAL